MKDRTEALKAMLEARPEDVFTRYALAMEYVKTSRLEEAVAEFRTLISHQPGYSYAYFHGGQALEQLGRLEEARAMYRQGIGNATDPHAKSELQGALDLLQ